MVPSRFWSQWAANWAIACSDVSLPEMTSGCFDTSYLEMSSSIVTTPDWSESNTLKAIRTRALRLAFISPRTFSKNSLKSIWPLPSLSNSQKQSSSSRRLSSTPYRLIPIWNSSLSNCLSPLLSITFRLFCSPDSPPDWLARARILAITRSTTDWSRPDPFGCPKCSDKKSCNSSNNSIPFFFGSTIFQRVFNCLCSSFLSKADSFFWKVSFVTFALPMTEIPSFTARSSTDRGGVYSSCRRLSSGPDSSATSG